jgi:ABC-type metal ion transport system substrate-binding protein
MINYLLKRVFIIAVRKEDKNDPRVKKLVKVLHDEDVQEWILKKWEGSVKPMGSCLPLKELHP